MQLYVSTRAKEELNSEYQTQILDGHGNPVGEIRLTGKGSPYLYDVFGTCESIYGDRLNIGLTGEIQFKYTTHGEPMYIEFGVLASEEMTTTWYYSEDEE